MADRSVEPLLEYLKTARGFDFTGYKRPSLERRVHHRLRELEIESYEDYVDYLEVHPEEFPQLFNTILINVTAFFRDAPEWEHLRTQVLPAMVQRKRDDEPFRVWCAACSSGEEAYTTAIVLAEALGIDRYRECVKIYATDVDEDALAQARNGVYEAKQLEPVPTELRERYFEATDGKFTFRRDLRRTVIFGRNDLLQDSPISRVDLLVCRNTLIYFNAETQTTVLDRLNFALREDGYLFVGKSEMLVKHSRLFESVDPKMRIFRKVPVRAVRDRYAFVIGENSDPLPQGSLLDAGADVGPVAQLVVDPDGTVVSANEQARKKLKIRPEDLGKLLQDLDVSYKPTDLRSALEEAYAERRPVLLDRVEWAQAPGDTRALDIEVTPVIANGRVLGASISFIDVTGNRRLQDDLDRSRRELEVAYEELQSTIEELETTNEELQSTNEELETTNEELQSTNEELETMNEEIQSVNDELETSNDELRTRGSEIDQVNAFLETVLTSLGTGVAVVDTDFSIQIWNKQAVELWGLREEEAEGQNLMALDIGLPVDQLREPIRSILSKEEVRVETVVDAVNRLGKPVTCRITVMPLRLRSKKLGAVLLTEVLEDD